MNSDEKESPVDLLARWPKELDVADYQEEQAAEGD